MWLLWCFSPLSAVSKGLLTLVILAVAGVFLRRKRQVAADVAKIPVAVWPEPDYTAPLILACGDGLAGLFGDQTLRVTTQGCYIREDDISQLYARVRALLHRTPRQAGQLSAMFFCCPDAHDDEAVLRGSLKAFRQQIKQISRLAGCRVPVTVCCCLEGAASPWFVTHAGEMVVYDDDSQQSLPGDWQQNHDNLCFIPLLNSAHALVQQIVLDELQHADRLCAPVYPLAVALRFGPQVPAPGSLWSDWLYQRTRLARAGAPSVPAAGIFPDPLLPLLQPYSSPIPGNKTACLTVAIVMLAAILALGISVKNNTTLVMRTALDLQRWYAIPMTHYDPKAQSLAVLQQDALLLERWHRQGEPVSYGLGLYTGMRLWLAVQQAIDSYIPPPPKPRERTPQTVRLDSMSLFDTGKWALKPGSTKILVSALVNIKAKPGWLIVVAGHTDNTGNDESNQQLSLKRAESVRDWMRDTGDVPESCFAVQGYGESRPYKTNDTPEGRAANRRVEISLVPQADACRVPGMKEPSPEDGGATVK